MSEQAPIHFLEGRTAHTRFEPFRRSFSYPVRMIEIDVARMAEAEETLKGFSVDRFNLMRVQTSKYGDRTSSDLSGWARDLFSKHDVETYGRTIRLMTFPDILGQGFSPISIWTLSDPDGGVEALIYEVHNTFGDQHAYVVPFAPDKSRHEAPKTLHVSPFWDVSGQYRFTVNTVGNEFSLLIENLSDNGRFHTATLQVTRKSATSAALIRRTVLAPFSGLAVIARIHWQALRLWLKGARYHSRPKAPEKAYSIATSSPSLETTNGRALR